VQTDLCTDSLRGYLEDGWHILAICPQPKQRRPDYVLGKGATPPQQSYSGCEKIEIQLLAPSAPVEGDDTPF
jgi:hypothetical protein